ncbi:MAG: hypothetical protein JHC95_02805 [Solirubrobacteraceae bacterium]|nr:hypothetical protein [Solirubrobacteraceae bacterium]
MGLITFLAATAHEGAEHESHDATLFYIAGGVLAAFAVLISAIGMSKPDFPSSNVVARGVMALGALLAAAAVASAVYVSS